MNVGYTFGMEEVKEIIVKHLNEHHGYVPDDSSSIVVLDENDKALVDAYNVQVFHNID